MKNLTETRLARKGTTECVAVLVSTSPRARTIGVNRPDGTPLGHVSRVPRTTTWSAFDRPDGRYCGTANSSAHAAALLVANDVRVKS